ncbi:hypothetical protein [Massilia cavernae]|uniref:hypothetical protein n=1 Tax=Massilia cavernae TaxID=2320864 RepID=UPI0011C4A585|nr:hypothetical protein [Massilia cavernae]
MNTKPAPRNPDSRVELEVERERNERQHNDDVKTGGNLGDDYRVKDARGNDSAANLHRQRDR